MTSNLSTTHDNDDEISVIDIVKFFQRRWRLIGLITLAVAVLASITSASKPTSYQKSATLYAENEMLLTILNPQDTDIPSTVSTTGNWAAETLETIKLEDVIVQSPTYTTTTQTLDFSLQASQPEALENIVSEVMAQLTAAWQVSLQEDIADRALGLEFRQQQLATAFQEVETAIAQLPSTNSPRLVALEAQRAQLLRDQAEVAFQQQYLQDLLDNLEEAAVDLLPLTVASEGPVIEQARSPLQIAILSLIAGFMVAVLLAIIVEQWPRWQAELAAVNATEPTQPLGKQSELD